MGWSARSRVSRFFDKAGKAAANSNGRIISLQGVSKRLRDVQVLNDIDLEIAQGECIVLVGRNGSGKSTLLRVLAGMLLPDSGSLRKPRHGRIMYALDGLSRLPFTSREYLWEMGRIRGMRPEILRQRISELSELLFLGKAIDQKLSQLSKGTLQKVNLIQALMPGPGGLLLLDEPLSGLDVPAQKAIVVLLRQWKKEGSQIVTACHEPLLIELLADQVIVLHKGTVLRRWNKEDLQQAGEPAVSIQSVIEGREQSVIDTLLVEHQGVIACHRSVVHQDYGRREVWDWRVSRSSADRIIGMILAVGGSILSVHPEESRLNMEGLMEGRHPGGSAPRDRTDQDSCLSPEGGDLQ
ncbi:ABC transporter ATP-binding protein [Paenibacillus sp. JNUCC31]|uniref:ATP-binding cassette domain-containing protein n=1 Tax=Paenibacillus sp. JNUCC-31 TaxID=2777983 RepID=UPI00178586AA|nr:ABC transporter ATP-binding protein [Paenibacillus sp. JNUCC-31]QOS78427.1 ABC transporter ATP-binding protein [Paenibacillus sp. JNUCC-31]